jgi:hypothetical protein
VAKLAGGVPGGGVALIRALGAVTNLKGDNEDQNHGRFIRGSWGRWLGRTSRLPGSPRMNNLLRDHS